MKHAHRWLGLTLSLILASGCSSGTAGKNGINGPSTNSDSELNNSSLISEDSSSKSGNSQTADSDNGSDGVIEEYGTGAEMSAVDVDAESISILSCSNYSNGYAWIQYDTQDGSRMISLIDKTGKIQPIKYGKTSLDGIQIYQTEDYSPASFEPFYEDYAVVHDGAGTWYWISKNLKIENRIVSTEEEEVLAAGGPYSLVKTDSSDYDSASRTLEMRDIHNEPVRTLDLEEESINRISNPWYYGQGIFRSLYGCTDPESDFSGSSMMFLTKKTIWIVDVVDGLFDSRFQEGSEVLATGFWPGEDDDGNRITGISYLKTDGDMATCSVDGAWDVSSQSSKDGWLLLRKLPTVADSAYPDGDYMSVRIGPDGIAESYPSGDKHDLIIDMQQQMKSPQSFSNDGFIILGATGADEKYYELILNGKFELMGDPIRGSAMTDCSDGMVVTASSTEFHVYKTKDGSLAYSTSDYGKIREYHDGVAFAALPSGFKNSNPSTYEKDEDVFAISPSEVIYLDEKGNRLFETIQ